MRKINISETGKRLDTISEGDILAFSDREEKVIKNRVPSPNLTELWTIRKNDGKVLFTKYSITDDRIFPYSTGTSYHLQKNLQGSLSLKLK